MIGLGLAMIFPFAVSTKNASFAFASIWIGMWSILVLLGLWKIEQFEIVGNKLIKINLLGSVKREYNLNNLVSHRRAIVNTDFLTNPLNLVRLFKKDQKYLVYRKVTLEFEGSRTVSIDERTMVLEDFNDLYRKIKGYAKGKQQTKLRLHSHK